MKRTALLTCGRNVLQSRGVGIFGALGHRNLKDCVDFKTIDIDHHEAVAVAAGLGHSCIVTKEGKLAFFGRAFDLRSIFRNYQLYRIFPSFARLAGRLTQLDGEKGKEEVSLTPKFVKRLDKEFIKSVVCSGGLTAALTDSGRLYCFGNNAYGQCGLVDLRHRFWEPLLHVGVPAVARVDVGLQHCLCVCINGKVYTWGKGSGGQMGNDSDTAVNSTPVLVPIKANCVAVAAGLNHSAALDTHGRVYVWGKRMSLDLVTGTEKTYQDQRSPRIVNLPEGLRAVDLYCSSFTTVVKCHDNSMWVMGLDETDATLITSFVQVMAPIDYSKYKGMSERDISNLPENKTPFIATDNHTIKKGYPAVTVISDCREKVYDVVLANGEARLVQVNLEPRHHGKIVDYSNGFRHSLLVTDST